MSKLEGPIEKIASEIHKPALKNYPTRKTIVQGIDNIFAIDLVDMSGYADMNDGNKFMLTVIDCLSRYAWAEPLKNKSAAEVLKAMKKIVSESKRTPDLIWSDAGSEFLNVQFKKWMKDNNISLYHTYSENKSAMIERFNRTLKTIMWKEFTINGNYNWIDIIDDLLETYNNKVHSSIKMTPTQASMSKNESILLARQNSDHRTFNKAKFKKGDKVRISYVKGMFEKGYTPKWSWEVYTIEKVHQTKPPTYSLKDDDKVIIKGSFYEAELQKTQSENIYLVETILKTRTVKGKKEFLVKWRGFSDKYNSWVKEKDITPLKPVKT